jgi:hypothetical protein
MAATSVAADTRIREAFDMIASKVKESAGVRRIPDAGEM